MMAPGALRPAGDPGAEVSLARKVAFLSSPDAYPGPPASVLCRETHMSWVFLTGTRVFKLKKPVSYPPLDFTTLERRRHFCAEEVRLNQRFTDGVYLQSLPLWLDQNGRLSLGGTGTIVDYLVEMRRLPADRMLDEVIRRGGLNLEDIRAVARRLGGYYRTAPPQRIAGTQYATHLWEELDIAEDILLHPRIAISPDLVKHALARSRALLRTWLPAINVRIANGHVLEGHADLRPEHVCLTEPPQIFDCLEFDLRLRLIDPYDELNYLGLECELLGAALVRPILLDTLEDMIGGRPDNRLIAAYGAVRALLRARISLAHLLDDHPSEPARWPGDTRAYLALAEAECDRAER